MHLVLDLRTDPARLTKLLARWMEKLAGGPQAKREDRTQLARVKGVGGTTTEHNKINFTFSAAYVFLFGVYSHVVVLGLSLRLSCYPIWWGWWLSDSDT